MIEDLEGEIWKDIPDYEGHYQVSNLGRVKSLKRKIPKILVPNYDGRGYYYVKLMMGGKNKDPKIHQLVAICFLYHKPDGHKLVIDHINNDSSDNRTENLQLVSTRFNGSKNKSSKDSKYTGVYKSGNRWVSSIAVNRKSIHLGSFMLEEDAADAYQAALKTLDEFGYVVGKNGIKVCNELTYEAHKPKQ